MNLELTRRHQGLALALALLAIAAIAKSRYHPGLGASSLDGDYYFQIARHVEEGDGFLTSVSLYYQGLRTLPHAATVYPLWPLLLGHAGRFLGLERAAQLVPDLLYLLDLVLLAVLAARLSRRLHLRPFVQSRWLVLDVGHVAILLLGTNVIFFRFTSLPYTEALSFALTFGALIALDMAVGDDDSADREISPAWCAAAGTLAGAAYLTRFQMVLLIPAITTALALAPGSKKVRGIVFALAPGMLAVALEAAYLAASVSHFTPAMLFDFAAYRESSAIEPFRWLVSTPSAWAWIKDRASGLLVAFDPRDENSYIASYGLAAYVPLIAVLGIVYPRGWLTDQLRSAPKASPLLSGIILSALGLLAPVHSAHATFFKAWLFGWRQGLPLVLLILASLAIVWAHPSRLFRLPCLGVVLVSVLGTFGPLAAEISSPPRGGPSAAETQLVQWLALQVPGPTILTTHAQQLSLWTRTGIHWTLCTERPDQTIRLLTHLPIDYLLVYSGEERCRFVASLGGRLDRVASFGEDASAISAFRLRK